MSSNDKLSIDSVISQVLVEEKSQQLASGGQSALVARTSGHSKSNTKDDKRKLKCGYCKKKGHSEDECRKKKADEAGSNSTPDHKGKSGDKEKDEHSANLALISSVHNAPLRLFVAQTHSHIPHMHWILDSGASTQPITVGNGNTVSAVGVGQIVLDTDLELALDCVPCQPRNKNHLRMEQVHLNCRTDNQKPALHTSYSPIAGHIQCSSIARQPNFEGKLPNETNPSTSYSDDSRVLNRPTG